MYDGDMDEEMEDFVGNCFEVSEVDSEYEFDAARFFDFTRPESSFEAEDAERWFETAGSYPPSPFIIKLKWREVNAGENANNSIKSNDGESMISSSNILDCDMDLEEFVLDANRKGPKVHQDMAQDILKPKTKYAGKSSKIRSSTLMKPTASHLAKLNLGREVHSTRLLGRSQKPLTKIDERSSMNSLGVDSDATKRQKLENGYLRKVARLKHQSLLSHKLPKVQQVDANTVNSRLKVTVPREPDLETAHRAQRHRFRTNSESDKHAKSKAPPFKARPLNSKILKAPLLSQRKSRPQSPVFKAFHLKTSERAMQHSSANALNMQNSDSISRNGTTDSERGNGEDAGKQEKCETIKRVKARPLSKKIIFSKKEVGTLRYLKEASATGELQLPNDNRLSHNPPTELFSKLTLKSDVEHNARSHTKPPLHPKGHKENVPDSFKQETRVSIITAGTFLFALSSKPNKKF